MGLEITFHNPDPATAQILARAATGQSVSKFADSQGKDRKALDELLDQCEPDMISKILDAAMTILGAGQMNGPALKASDRKKVAVFAECHKADLAKIKQTPDGFVSKFCEAQKRGVTAEQYIGVK